MKSNLYNPLQPIKRSKLRLKLGKAYYTYARYLLWLSPRFKFAKQYADVKLQYLCFNHKSLLLRQLRDVDMTYQYNKITNLKLAVSRLNHIIIKPGETFSYWKLIGKPTYKKGYVDGMVLFCGSFGPGVGGGLCQLSNLIFWMTLHTPLTVVERYRHSYDVFPDASRTQPFGSGATCIYPYRDLIIRNDTNETYQLCLKVGERYLEGQWRSEKEPLYHYKIIERNHLIKSEYWGGYSRHNEIYRQIFDKEENKLEEEYVMENHALMMYAPFIAYESEQKVESL